MIGRTIGPYLVLDKLGAGGMGEVYRARDARLNRDVALKVLPTAFAQDAERLARLKREAQVLASLSHPHIAQIHGFEDADGAHALAMELVEGRTLDQWIASSPPLTETLRVARQIADALSAAHDQGVIHRDLKPANVKVTDDGVVKVLDFGLAKADVGHGGRESRLSDSPTLTTPAATAMGMILGTAAYMAPEQAKGHRVDKRADVWAFGCVLYEMLTGKRAFEGTDVTDTLAAVLRSEPDLSALPSDVPPGVRQLVERCLVKDRRERIRDLSTAIFLLDWTPPADAATTPGTGGPRSRAALLGTPSFLVPAALLAGMIAGVVVWHSLASPDAPGSPARLTLVVPADKPVSRVGTPGQSLAISPDGTRIVYTSLNAEAPPERRGQLRVRSLSSFEIVDLPGTYLARQPFFSPDGRSVGFFTEGGELRKVPIDGGNPVTIATGIADATWAQGVWLDSDTIVFGGPGVGGLQQVDAGGGTPQRLTELAEGEVMHWPTGFLPESGTVLFYAYGAALSTGHVEAVHPGSGARTRIVESTGAGWALRSGHLLFDQDETLLVAPFDPGRLELTGPAVALGEAVQRGGPIQQLGVSHTGTLVYMPRLDPAGYALGRLGPGGTFDTFGGPAGSVGRPRVTADGRQAAAAVRQNNDFSIRIFDLVRGTSTVLRRPTSTPAAVWHPDSRTLVIKERTADGERLLLRQSDGREHLLVESDSQTLLHPDSVSPDGSLLLYTRQNVSRHSLWTVPLDGASSPAAVLDPGHSGAFSPDGRHLAYVGGVMTAPEVRVRAYPDGDDVLVATGTGPRWSPDGRTLYFDNEENFMMVPFRVAGGAPDPGQPQVVTSRRTTATAGAAALYARSQNQGAAYDVLPDGRLLVIRQPDTDALRELVVVQNWFAELERVAPTR